MLFCRTASLAGEHQAPSSAGTQQSARTLARLAMVWVVLGEDKLLTGVQADVAADGSGPSCLSGIAGESMERKHQDCVFE